MKARQPSLNLMSVARLSLQSLHPCGLHPSSFPLFSEPACEALGLLARLFDGADHVESLFGQVVVLAVDDFLKAADGVGSLDELALEAGELLGDEEGLREEALNLARARDDQLVIFGKLVEAEDGA